MNEGLCSAALTWRDESAIVSFLEADSAEPDLFRQQRGSRALSDDSSLARLRRRASHEE